MGQLTHQTIADGMNHLSGLLTAKLDYWTAKAAEMNALAEKIRQATVDFDAVRVSDCETLRLQFLSFQKEWQSIANELPLSFLMPPNAYEAVTPELDKLIRRLEDLPRQLRQQAEQAEAARQWEAQQQAEQRRQESQQDAALAKQLARMGYVKAPASGE